MANGKFGSIDRSCPFDISVEVRFCDAQIDIARPFLVGSDKRRHIVHEFQATSGLSREMHVFAIVRRFSMNAHDLKNIVGKPELRSLRLVGDMRQRKFFAEGLLICRAGGAGKQVGVADGG